MAKAGLKEALLKDDDWTGKTDPAERRRRQNRLHQRAWRRRQKELQQGAASESPPDTAAAGSINPKQVSAQPLATMELCLRQLAANHVSQMKGRPRMLVPGEAPRDQSALWTALETLGEAEGTFAFWAELKAQFKDQIMADVLSQYVFAVNPLDEARCRSHMEFPMSADHQLITLIQYNTLRGVLTNMSIILYLSGYPLEGWGEFYTEDLPVPPDNVPSTLIATPLQKTVPHESWISCVPYAALRDNIIRNQDSLDLDELCNDFVGGMYFGWSDVGNRGMILWGDPWSEDGWELSEGFVKKWKTLLRGCGELIKSTNKWREARHEERLVVEL